MDHVLVLRSDYGLARSFHLQKGRLLIGRSAACDVRVSVPTVDLRHCEIMQEDDGTLQISACSPSGTVIVNGSPVRQTGLSEGDTVAVGPAVFEVQGVNIKTSVDPLAPSPAQIRAVAAESARMSAQRRQAGAPHRSA